MTSGYTWSCNIRSFTMTDSWKNKSNIYINRFDLPYPKNQRLSSNPDKNCRDKCKYFINYKYKGYSPIFANLFLACHCVNKHWFFGAYERDTELVEGEQEAGRIYRTYLSNFIKRGDPNDDNLPVHLPSFQKNQSILHVNSNFTFSAHQSNNELCDALDEVDYYNQT